LKDLAAAAKVPYSEDTAKKLVQEHQDPTKKTLNYEQFKHLIKSLVHEEPRFHLTQTLMMKLEDEPTENAPTTVPTTAGEPAKPAAEPTTEPTKPAAVTTTAPTDKELAENKEIRTHNSEVVRNLQKTQTAEEKAKRAEARSKRGAVSLPWTVADTKRYRPTVTVRR